MPKELASVELVFKIIRIMYSLSRLLLTGLVFSAFCLFPLAPQAQSKKKKKAAQEQEAVTPAKMTTDKPEAQALYDRGFRDFESKNFDSAVQHYRAALKVDPSFLNALDQMALAYRHGGQTDSANHYFRMSTATNPNGLMAHQELASMFMEQKDYRNALKEHQDVIRLDPENPEAFLASSKTLFLLENFSAAIEHGKKATQLFDKAKTANPSLGEAQYFVGMSFFYTENRENAKLYLKKAKANGVAIPKDLQADLNIK